MASLQNQWGKIKGEARKHFSSINANLDKTGGGPYNVPKNDILGQARSIMHKTSIKGLDNPYDSDAIMSNEIENDESDDGNSAIFDYLLKKGEITDWSERNARNLSSPKNLPLTDAPQKRENYTMNRLRPEVIIAIKTMMLCLI